MPTPPGRFFPVRLREPRGLRTRRRDRGPPVRNSRPRRGGPAGDHRRTPEACPGLGALLAGWGSGRGPPDGGEVRSGALGAVSALFGAAWGMGNSSVEMRSAERRGVSPYSPRRNSGPTLLTFGGWCGYVGVKTPRLIAPRMRKTRPRAGGGGHSRHPEFGEGAAVTLAWRSVNRAGFRAPARCRAPPGGLPGGRRSKPSPRFFPFGGTRFRGPRGRGAGPPTGRTGRRSHPHCPWRGCTTSRQVACGRRGIVAKLSTVRRGKRVRSRLPDPGSDRVLLAFPEMPGFPNGFSTKCGKCGKPHCPRVRRP